MTSSSCLLVWIVDDINDINDICSTQFPKLAEFVWK